MSDLNKKEVISRLCALSTAVGWQKYEHTVSHDCFCGLNKFSDTDFRLDQVIIEFIENAVYEKLDEEKMHELSKKRKP